MVMLHIKLKGVTDAATWNKIYFGWEPPPTLSKPGGQKVKIHFYRTLSYQIK